MLCILGQHSYLVICLFCSLVWSWDQVFPEQLAPCGGGPSSCKIGLSGVIHEQTSPKRLFYHVRILDMADRNELGQPAPKPRALETFSDGSSALAFTQGWAGGAWLDVREKLLQSPASALEKWVPGQFLFGPAHWSAPVWLSFGILKKTFFAFKAWSMKQLIPNELH